LHRSSISSALVLCIGRKAETMAINVPRIPRTMGSPFEAAAGPSARCLIGVTSSLCYGKHARTRRRLPARSGRDRAWATRAARRVSGVTPYLPLRWRAFPPTDLGQLPQRIECLLWLADRRQPSGHILSRSWPRFPGSGHRRSRPAQCRAAGPATSQLIGRV
jgi:hypothetical protein